MRVVFVTHNFPRHPGDVAGSFLLPLAMALQAQGAQVRVIAPSDRGKGGDDLIEGIEVRRVRYASAKHETLAYSGKMLGALRSPAGWKALFGLFRALRAAVKQEMREGADIVHAHWWVPAGLAVPRGVPMVLTVHGTDVGLLARSRMARRLARPVFARAKVVTAVSRDLAAKVQTYVQRHIPDTYVQAMPASPPMVGWSTGGGGLVTIARLVPQKRVELAIEALAHLRGVGFESTLTIVGDGPERESLEAFARTQGVHDAVRFVGAVPPKDVAGYLATADLMLFPAEGEGFGLVAAEALMAGVPVVACWDGGGVLDIVPERGAGRLVLPRPEAIADAALDLLQDPDRHATVRLEGEKWRVKLAAAIVATACLDWYEEARHA